MAAVRRRRRSQRVMSSRHSGLAGMGWCPVFVRGALRRGPGTGSPSLFRSGLGGPTSKGRCPVLETALRGPGAGPELLNRVKYFRPGGRARRAPCRDGRRLLRSPRPHPAAAARRRLPRASRGRLLPAAGEPVHQARQVWATCLVRCECADYAVGVARNSWASGVA